MEDIISLDMIKRLSFQKNNKRLSDEEAENFLIVLEKKIVDYCRHNSSVQINSSNLEELCRQIKNDEQYKRAYKRFIEQNKLSIDKNSSSYALVKIIAKNLSEMI